MLAEVSGVPVPDFVQIAVQALLIQFFPKGRFRPVYRGHLKFPASML
jgi:hypothetical protein